MKTVVLIVEDEWLVRCQLADEFREAGFVVLEAASAEHAMALCHDRTLVHVHVLITDIQLSGSGSGWDVAKAFRALWKNVPVVYTSGNALDGKQSASDSLFFAKPYRAAEIVSSSQQLISQTLRMDPMYRGQRKQITG